MNTKTESADPGVTTISRRKAVTAIAGALAVLPIVGAAAAMPIEGRNDRRLFELIAQHKPLLAHCRAAVTDQEVDECCDATWKVEEAIYRLELESPRALAAQLSFHNEIAERDGGASFYTGGRDGVMLKNLHRALVRMGGAS